MRKTIKYIGLDVHQKSISIAVADNERATKTGTTLNIKITQVSSWQPRSFTIFSPR